MDPEFKKQIGNIELELRDIKKRIGGNWNVLWRGVLSGASYVIGATLIIIVIGWILNIIGVIPALQKYAAELQAILGSLRR